MSNTPPSRTKREALSENSKAVLRTWFNNHVKSPYPSQLEKHKLAEMAGVSFAQVNNWFAYTRRIARHDKIVLDRKENSDSDSSPTKEESNLRPCRKMSKKPSAPNVQVATVYPLSFTQKTTTNSPVPKTSTYQSVSSCSLPCCLPKTRSGFPESVVYPVSSYPAGFPHGFSNVTDVVYGQMVGKNAPTIPQVQVPNAPNPYSSVSDPNNNAGQFLYQNLVQTSTYTGPMKEQYHYPSNHWSSQVTGQPRLTLDGYSNMTDYSYVEKPSYQYNSLESNPPVWKPPGIETFLRREWFQSDSLRSDSVRSDVLQTPNFRNNTASLFSTNFQTSDTCKALRFSSEQYQNPPSKAFLPNIQTSDTSEVHKFNGVQYQNLPSKSFHEPLYIDTASYFSPPTSNTSTFVDYQSQQASVLPECDTTPMELLLPYNASSQLYFSSEMLKMQTHPSIPSPESSSARNLVPHSSYQYSQNRTDPDSSAVQSTYNGTEEQYVGNLFSLSHNVTSNESLSNQPSTNPDICNNFSVGQDYEAEYLENSSSSSTLDSECPKNAFRPIRSPLSSGLTPSLTPSLTTEPPIQTSNPVEEPSFTTHPLASSNDEITTELAYPLTTESKSLTAQLTTFSGLFPGETFSAGSAQLTTALNDELSTKIENESTLTTQLTHLTSESAAITTPLTTLLTTPQSITSTPDLISPLTIALTIPSTPLTPAKTTSLTTLSPSSVAPKVTAFTSLSTGSSLPSFAIYCDEVMSLPTEEEEDDGTLTREVEAAQALVDLQGLEVKWKPYE